MLQIKKIKESIIVKWLVLYYTFFFILGMYVIGQLLITSLLFLLKADSYPTGIQISGFNVTIGETEHQLWDFPQFYASLILNAIVICIAVLYLTKLVYNTNPFDYLGIRKIVRKHRIWFLYTLLALMVFVGVALVLNFENIPEIKTNGFWDKLLMVLGIAVFGPVLEEVVFRGYLLRSMDTLFKGRYQWLTVFITALIFSLIHFQYTFTELVFVFSLGLFMGFVAIKTQNLAFSILFHCMWNFLTILPFFVN